MRTKRQAEEEARRRWGRLAYTLTHRKDSNASQFGGGPYEVGVIFADFTGHTPKGQGWSWDEAFAAADRRGNPAAVLRLQNPSDPAHPAVEAFWKQILDDKVPHEEWQRGIDIVDGPLTVNLEQATTYDVPEVWIEMIESRARGLGLASKALRYLTDTADRHGVTLLLVPDSQDDGGLSTDDLEAWYRRHGFKPYSEERFGEESEVFVRFPRKSNPDLTKLSYMPPPGFQGFWKEFAAGTSTYYDWARGGDGRREGKHVWLNLENDFDHPFVWIENLGCNDRGKGLATKALKWLCDLADRWGVELRLHAEALDPKEGLTTRQLRQWYARHGFKPVPGRATTMRRRPRS